MQPPTDLWSKKYARKGVSSSGAKLYINAPPKVAASTLFRVCALMKEDDFDEIPEDEEVAPGKICEGTGRRAVGGGRVGDVALGGE